EDAWMDELTGRLPIDAREAETTPGAADDDETEAGDAGSECATPQNHGTEAIGSGAAAAIRTARLRSSPAAWTAPPHRAGGRAHTAPRRRATWRPPAAATPSGSGIAPRDGPRAARACAVRSGYSGSPRRRKRPAGSGTSPGNIPPYRAPAATGPAHGGRFRSCAPRATGCCHRRDTRGTPG